MRKRQRKENRKVPERVRKNNLLAPLKIACAVLFLLCFSLGGATCSVWGTNVVRVSGSTTLLPLVQEGADRYMDLYGDRTVLVQGGGSSVGIAQVKEGIVDIANSSRDLKPEEDDGNYVDNPIALDVIAIVVHPGVPVDDLSSAQVKGIFTGGITNWQEVGGADEPILVVVRDQASGTREMFDKEALDGEDATGSAIESNSNGIVRETVAATPNSIGYISIGYVNSSIKAIAYDGVVPTNDSGKDGSYALSRYLHMYTYGEPSPPAQEFIDYLLSEEFQLGVVAQEYIPVIGLDDE
jgi:phosphate transport system substrate-binding protein